MTFLNKIAPEPKKYIDCCTSMSIHSNDDEKKHFSKVDNWLWDQGIHSTLKSTQYGSSLIYKLTEQQLGELYSYLGTVVHI